MPGPESAATGLHEATEVSAPIFVTKAFVPPEVEYLFWLRKALSSGVLTNNGPIHRELEETLRTRFEVPHLRLMANGTLALQLAIRALGVKGKVITTPYSYVATTSAILWEGCEPVFVDIKPDTFCIDPELIEAAITPDTTAILATHVYGIPCDVEAIDVIAKKHGLKVIYDAAHAFDVKYKGRSILQWGNASTLSFHATKLFHTVEGGAVVLHNEEDAHRVRLLRSFGHIGDEHYTLGMNAKMSELHAAMGMAVIPHVQRLVQERSQVIGTYSRLLEKHAIRPPILSQSVVWNCGYLPVIIPHGRREDVVSAMESDSIFPRRYFFPSLNTLPYVERNTCPVSESMAMNVLCLPLYEDLPEEQILRICKVIEEVL